MNGVVPGTECFKQGDLLPLMGETTEGILTPLLDIVPTIGGGDETLYRRNVLLYSDYYLPTVWDIVSEGGDSVPG